MSKELELQDADNDTPMAEASSPLKHIIDHDGEPITRPVKIVAEGSSSSDSTTTTINTLDGPVLTIALDDQERQLFDNLLATARALEDAPQPKSVQIRVAGGWVRDKILGLPTHDVDIALDSCTGVEFANYFKEYLLSQQRLQQQEEEECSASSETALNNNNNKNTKNNNNTIIGRIGVIAANPAQSKHLETATLRAFGLEVDFSNLRHETYAEDSRIPTIVIGTPVEDSYRRDFTINALYFHLQSGRVEDWTKRGLQDLLSPSIGKITTPLPAYQTFHDDPLRVLRAIRFAVRYQRRLDDSLIEAAMHPQIHGELHRKVSRERVGKELEGMLSGKNSNPRQALKLICDLKLAGSVFCVPADDTIMGPIGHAHLQEVTYTAADKHGFDKLRQVAWEESRECLRVLPRVMEALGADNTDNSSSNSNSSNNNIKQWNDDRLLFLSVVLLPYERLQYVVKNKAKSVIEYMMREGVKIKNKDVVSMVTINEQLDAMVQLLQAAPEPTPEMRLQAGLILRSTKDLWQTTMAVATVVLLRKEGEEFNTNGNGNSTLDWCQRARDWHTVIRSKLQLDGCWTVKPLMNGKDIIHCLGLDRGPQVGIYNQEQIRWMLQHPKGTLEECQHFLKDCQRQRESEQDQTAQHVAKKMHL